MSIFDQYDCYFKTETEDKLLNAIQSSDEDCKHLKTVFKNGYNICDSCGIEMDQFITYDKNVLSQQQEIIICKKDKSIHRDLQNIEISDHIKDIANSLYLQVCGNKIHRGKRRYSIIFACVLYAYRKAGNVQNPDTLMRLFKIEKKDVLEGIKFVNENAPKLTHKMYITPEHIISEHLKNFNVSNDKKEEILQLYQMIKGKSATLNRSRPQSVSAGIIWYWIRYIRKESEHITIKDFVQKVDLSELTVNKITKEILRIHEKIKSLNNETINNNNETIETIENNNENTN